MGLAAALFNELRSSMATPEKWLVDFFNGGAETKSGTRVTEETALNLSAVFNAVTILGGTVMQLPCILYRRDKDDKKHRAKELPEYSLLKTCVTRRMTSSRWLQTSMGHLALYGNAYSQKGFRGDGRVGALGLLRPDRTWPETKAGALYYNYEPRTGPPISFEPEEIVHIPGLGFDGVRGYGVIQLARESLGLGMAAEEFGARFFGEGTHPGIIATTPKAVKQATKDDLKKDLANKHSGLGKAHKFLLLEEGMDFKTIGVNPDDAQFLETRKFQTIEVARWFNLPPHMLKDLERATFSNIEHQSIEFLTINMGPWLQLLEDELALQLLGPEALDEYFIEFKREAFLKGDTESRYKAYATAKNWGWLNTNMILKKENEDPVGPEGDVFWMPANMVPATVALENTPKAGQTDDRQYLKGTELERYHEELKERTAAIQKREKRATPAAARIRIADNYHRMIKDAVGRIVRREVNDLKGAVKKHLRTRDVSEFTGWLDGFYKKHTAYVEKNLKPVMYSLAEEIYAASAEEIGEDYELTDELESYRKDYLTVLTTRYIKSSRGQIDKVVRDTEPEDMATVIETRLDEWEETRPTKIADREKVDARSAFATVVFLASGYRLVWRARGSSPCPYCTMLDGKVIGRNENFLEAGDELVNPDDAELKMVIKGPKKHPQLHRGCECLIEAEGQ